jgi:hypothetical protein
MDMEMYMETEVDYKPIIRWNERTPKNKIVLNSIDITKVIQERRTTVNIKIIGWHKQIDSNIKIKILAALPDMKIEITIKLKFEHIHPLIRGYIKHKNKFINHNLIKNHRTHPTLLNSRWARFRIRIVR